MKLDKLFTKLKQSSFFSTLILFLILIIVNVILQPNFFSYSILKSNITTFTPLILLAMAQAIILISGGVDLSVGASVTLINVIVASIMKDSISSVIIALLAGFAVALCIGLVNGFIAGFLKLPALVATFASAAVWFGLALLIMPQPGGYVPEYFYKLYTSSILFIPVPLILIIAAFLIWGFLKLRPIQHHIYAVGGNEESARASGIKVKRTKLSAYLIASIFVAFAAFAVTAQSASGDANIGQAFTLPSIAAVVIGGVSLYGGKGSLLGALLGAISLSILTNIIYFANIPSLYQDLIKGLIIILSLAIALIPGLRKFRLNFNGR